MAQRRIEVGGKAAREVYGTPELRGWILELLDRTTLARMLRLERGITASAAGVLI